jgi:hypothetical protein
MPIHPDHDHALLAIYAELGYPHCLLKSEVRNWTPQTNVSTGDPGHEHEVVARSIQNPALMTAVPRKDAAS